MQAMNRKRASTPPTSCATSWIPSGTAVWTKRLFPTFPCWAPATITPTWSAPEPEPNRSGEKLQRYIDYFQDHCRKAAEGTGAHVITRVDMSFAPFLIDENAPVLQPAIRALKDLGIQPRIEQGGQHGRQHLQRQRPARHRHRHRLYQEPHHRRKPGSGQLPQKRAVDPGVDRGSVKKGL